MSATASLMQKCCLDLYLGTAQAASMPHMQSAAADDCFRAVWRVPITHLDTITGTLACCCQDPSAVNAFPSPNEVRPLPVPPSPALPLSSLSGRPRASLCHCCCHWQQVRPLHGWEPWTRETSAASPMTDQGMVAQPQYAEEQAAYLQQVVLVLIVHQAHLRHRQRDS